MSLKWMHALIYLEIGISNAEIKVSMSHRSPVNEVGWRK
jgi:hypothetical protein